MRTCAQPQAAIRRITLLFILCQADPETFYHAGVAFGCFLKEMSDVDVDENNAVIPDLHNTMSRYLDLEQSIARDPKGRVQQVCKEIEFVRARVDRYGMISEALESGRIPTRIWTVPALS